MITIGGRAHTIEELLEVSKLGYPFVEISLDDPVTVAGWIPQLREVKDTYGISFLAHYPNEDNPFDVNVLRKQVSSAHQSPDGLVTTARHYQGDPAFLDRSEMGAGGTHPRKAGTALPDSRLRQ